MKDFLRALAEKLAELFGEDCRLYYGRVLQGAKRPCFFVQPPRVCRQTLPGGRVKREYGVVLRFYDGPADEQSNGYEQQQVGERLLVGLQLLHGEKRCYRGRELSYEPGAEFLQVQGEYEFYTTPELECDEELLPTGELMEIFGFSATAR